MKIQVNFNEVYNETYEIILKYIVLHCDDLNDVNDLLQDTYLAVYDSLKKKRFSEIRDINKYVIGICKNVLKKYYRFKYKNKNIISIYNEEYPNEAFLKDFDVDLELQIITKENVEYIWKYINNKDVKIAKIFYLYYCLDMKINDIATEMQLNESTVKNYIYRTINELKNNFDERR